MTQEQSTAAAPQAPNSIPQVRACVSCIAFGSAAGGAKDLCCWSVSGSPPPKGRRSGIGSFVLSLMLMISALWRAKTV